MSGKLSHGLRKIAKIQSMIVRKEDGLKGSLDDLPKVKGLTVRWKK